MLACLSLRIPVRGAIEYGFAAALEDDKVHGDIFGPVVADAHDLESKMAQYPRILVGRGIWNYILSKEKKEELARECAGLIIVDRDGQGCLDWLGPQFRKMLGDDDVFPDVKGPDLVAKGLKFASDEHKKYAVAGDNQKLALRYALLMEYYFSRIRLWGIAPPA